MMKNAARLVAALLVAVIPLSAQALTVGGTFNVAINLVSACSVNTATLAPTFNYTSGQAAPAAFATAQSFTVTCTTSTPYTLALDAGGTGYTGAFTAPTGTYTNTATGLTYSLTLPATTAGTGAAQTYALTGSMAAGQVGTCAATVCAAADVHTLMVTY